MVFPRSPRSLPNIDPTLANGGTIEYMNPGAGKPGYMSSWTFNLQRELPAQFLLDIGYIGQRGTNLPSGLENLNQVDVKYLCASATRSMPTSTPRRRGPRESGSRMPALRDRFRRRLRPYPQFSDIRNLYEPIGWSTYHAMQMRLQKRYSSGVNFLAAYTLSKSLVSGGGYTGLRR